MRFAVPVGLLCLLLLPSGAQAQLSGNCQNGQAYFGGQAYACSNVDLLTRVSLAQMGASAGNDVWGWADPLTGREYALMGLDNGTYFVDVTAPTEPRLLGKLPTSTTSSTWRDMKVYKDHAFVVSEAPGHGMQVFDLRHLRGLEPDPARVFEADVDFTGPAGHTLGSAHNIAINKDTGRAYVVGARNQIGAFACAGGLYIVDISDPVSPEFAGCFAADGYTHDVQCVVYKGPDTAHHGKEICFASNENTVTIVDVTNPASPVMLSHVLYPNTGYTHQGWLTDDQQYFFVNDEFDEQNYNLNTRTITMDVSSLTNPQYIGSYFHPTQAITHNLFIDGDLLFAANYTTGLRIVDISSMWTPNGLSGVTTAGYFDTHPPHSDRVFQGAWSNYPYLPSGNVLVSDINGGLFVLRHTSGTVSTDPEVAVSVAEVDVYPNPAGDVLNVLLKLDREQHVSVELLDVLGRRVAELYAGDLAAGSQHELSLRMDHLPQGLYVLRVAGEHFTQSQRVTRVQ